ncbi:hypothetical protein [uncultured Amnibacterium sp.]|uniref:hypothetical protein n=1 Tax=uncultured Amnibacterium sp. TaxID=1631851 RepID=UPI0035CB7235
MHDVEPMSDRRAVVLVVALLVAVIGAVIAVAAGVSLRDPFTVSGEIGTRVDISRGLVAAVAAGCALVLAGCGTVAALVRAQLRAAR